MGLTFAVLITQCRLSHVSEFDGPFRARVHEEVALRRVEFGGSDDFRQFLHVYRLDVHDVCIEFKSRIVSISWFNLLKLWSLMLRFHKFTRKSSAEMYVSPSELIDIELIW